MVQLYDARNRPITSSSLRQPLPTRFGLGTGMGWERITDGTQVDPQWVAMAIRRMESGDVGSFVLLVQRLLERFPAAGAAVSRITDALGRKYRVTPASERRTDVKVADAYKRVFESDAYIRGLTHVRDAIPTGYSVSEMRWAEVAGWFVPVEFKRVKADAIAWADDGETPLLRVGYTYEFLQRHRFITHVSTVRSGLPVNVGVGKTLAYLYLFYTLAMAAYSGYGERYGAPWVKGTHPPGSPQEYIDKLKDAARTLTAEGSVIMEEGLTLEFMDAMANNNTATGQFFYDFIRLLDKQAAVAVQGFDMSDTGSGSRALGEVLERFLDRRIRSFAWNEAATMRRDVGESIFAWNVSEELDKPRPKLELDLEDSIDLKKLADGLGPLIDRGLEVEVAQALDLAGLPIPKSLEPGLLMHPVKFPSLAHAIDPEAKPDTKAKAYAETILRIVDEIEDTRDKRTLAKRIRAIAREAGFDLKRAA